jgi:glutamate-1-semialdehyde 2,1-aminomutase
MRTFAVSKTQEVYQRALKSIPRGTHSDSRCRVPYPTYAARAEGAWIYDVDGNRFLDCLMGNGAVLLGYRCPEIERALAGHIKDGLMAGVESELSVTAAERFLRLVSMAEVVRFATTGTEAMMHVLSMARAYTGRANIAKPEGSYHGWYDYTFVGTWPDVSQAGEARRPRSLPGTAGLHPQAVSSTLVLPFNDIEATEQLLRANADSLAAVVLEPVMIDIGWIPATKTYLQKLREVTRELGILLIFDELLTGFRIALGGAQEFYDVQPDLSIFGKAIANGYILSAVAGRRDLMDPDPTVRARSSFVGTFNGHPLSLAASVATLDILADGEVLAQLQQRTEILISEFASMCRKHGISAQLRGGGGHFHWYFTEAEITDYRSAATSNASLYKTFSQALLERGVLCTSGYLQHHALSSAHKDAELEFLIAAMENAIEEVAKSIA